MLVIVGGLEKMIRSFEIHNFKLFETLALDGLGAVTLVGGQHNVGATALLEAAFLFCDQLNPEMLLKPITWRGLQVIAGPESVFASCFYRYKTTRPIRLAAIDESGSRGLEIVLDPANTTRRIVFNAENKLPPGPSAGPQPAGPGAAAAPLSVEPSLHLKYLQDNKVVNTADIVIKNGRLEMRFSSPPNKLPPTICLPARVPTNPKAEAERYGELEIMQQTDLVLDLVRTADPQIQSLSAIHMGGTGLIHADIGLGRKIPIPFLGDTVGRLLSLILAMSSAPHGMVLVDELANACPEALLPQVLRKLVAAADHFNCQVLATTRQMNLPSSVSTALAELRPTDFAYFHLDRTAEGSVVRRYSPHDVPTEASGREPAPRSS